MRRKKDSEVKQSDDIFIYDTSFRKMFELGLSSVPILQKKVNDLTSKLGSCVTDGQKENVMDEIALIKQQIDTLDNNETYTLYVMETEPILEQYKFLMDQKCTDTFTGKSELYKFERKKKKILNDYIRIARKYDKEYILPIKSVATNICENCKSTNIEMEDDRIGHCLDCGAIKENLINSNIVRDSTRTRSNTSDCKNHIIDVVQKFQGQQNTHIKDEVYENIEKILMRYNLLNESDKKIIRFERVTKEDVQMALEECKYMNYYDDCQLIFTNLTGKPGPDLSDIIDDVYDDHEKICAVYPECVEQVLKKYDNRYTRKSMMSGHYLLYQILTRRKYPCKKEDFNILKSEGPLFFHDKVYKRICKVYGWSMVHLL